MHSGAGMSIRFRFVESGGCRILRVDFSGLSPEEHIPALDTVRDLITHQPPKSILLLSLSNDRFTAASAGAMKQYAHEIDSFVRAHAIVCRRGFRSALAATFNVQVQHDIQTFEQESEAEAWLRSLG